MAQPHERCPPRHGPGPASDACRRIGLRPARGIHLYAGLDLATDARLCADLAPWEASAATRGPDLATGARFRMDLAP